MRPPRTVDSTAGFARCGMFSTRSAPISVSPILNADASRILRVLPSRRLRCPGRGSRCSGPSYARRRSRFPLREHGPYHTEWSVPHAIVKAPIRCAPARFVTLRPPPDDGTAGPFGMGPSPGWPHPRGSDDSLRMGLVQEEPPMSFLPIQESSGHPIPGRVSRTWRAPTRLLLRPRWRLGRVRSGSPGREGAALLDKARPVAPARASPGHAGRRCQNRLHRWVEFGRGGTVPSGAGRS